MQQLLATKGRGEGASARWGFVIDQGACVGCHACTVACTAENAVPLGFFRTWVKTVETGAGPDARRHFQVNRCQHCERAPCVTICPTGALFRRSDGIVDLDPARCTGCGACMQACPYDALYLDPLTRTAAKCHFCAHRVDAGLLPACAVACPTDAIVVGDLADPTSRIAALVKSGAVVRKPEQRTAPRTYYLAAHESTLDPFVAFRDDAYLWANRDVPAEPWEPTAADALPNAESGAGGTTVRTARLAYDVEGPRPWGGRVAASIWLRLLGAGILFVAALLLAFAEAPAGLGGTGELAVFGLASSSVALGGSLVGLLLLAFDVRRPSRLWRLVARPNLRSWLVWGGWLQVVFAGVAAYWGVSASGGWVPPWLMVAAMLASASLVFSLARGLGQADGRDLWQSPLLFPQMLTWVMVAGGASILLLGVAADFAPDRVWRLSALLAASLAASGFIAYLRLVGGATTPNAVEAAQSLLGGIYRDRYWGLVAALGVLLPLLLLVVALALPALPLADELPQLALLVGLALPAFAATLVLFGLWLETDLLVRAGQHPPLS